MNACRLNCNYLALLIAVAAGVLLGILYALGFVATGIVFWVYLLIGVAGILLTPLYSTGASSECTSRCFARYCTQILVGAIGTVLLAAVGLLVAPIASVTIVAIVLGGNTLFVTLLLATLVCFVECLN